jgi:uncharacterized protein
MPLEVGWKALRLAFSGPPGQPACLSFFGGEPMLEFPTMVRLARVARRLGRRTGRQVLFSVTTNATLLRSRHLRFFRHYGFAVALSVDGPEAVHDRHRPFVSGRGSARLVWANLARAAVCLPHLRALVVVSPGSVDSLPDTVARLRGLGIERISLLPNVDTRWDPEARERLRAVYHRLARACLASLAGPRPLRLNPFFERFSRGPGRLECGFGRDEVAVAPSGNLYPCGRLVGSDSRADIRVGHVDEGVDAARVEAVRQVSARRMQSCGTDGPCGCVSLMPGKVCEQLERYQFFRRTAEEAARAARVLSALAWGAPEKTPRPTWGGPQGVSA